MQYGSSHFFVIMLPYGTIVFLHRDTPFIIVVLAPIQQFLPIKMHLGPLMTLSVPKSTISCPSQSIKVQSQPVPTLSSNLIRELALTILFALR